MPEASPWRLGEFVHFRLKRTAGHTGVGAHGGLRRPHFGLGILAGGIKNTRPFQFAHGLAVLAVDGGGFARFAEFRLVLVRSCCFSAVNASISPISPSTLSLRLRMIFRIGEIKR